MYLEVHIDEARFAELEAEMGNLHSRLPAAISRAINTVAKGAEVKIVRGVAADINLTHTEIRRRNISVTKATPDSLTSWVNVFGRRIPLAKFGARWGGVGTAGTRYRIKKGVGRTLLEGAFMATMKSGHVGVFMRKAQDPAKKHGLPISEKYGPSVPAVVENLPELAEETMRAEISDRLEYEIDNHVRLIRTGVLK